MLQFCVSVSRFTSKVVLRFIDIGFAVLRAYKDLQVTCGVVTDTVGLTTSSVFTARRYAYKRGVRPSVRLSVTLVYCIHTAEDIVKLLCRPGSPNILVVLTPCADIQFQGEPRKRERKIHGVGKCRHFRLKSPFISKTVRDRPMVTMER